MSIFKEFKEFATKGNAIDLAIGVVIGGAFQSIVNSLVNDIIMPLMVIFTGSIDYSDWKIIVGVAEIGIGSFINTLINFLIIAFSIFLAMKYVNKINKKIGELNKEAIKTLEKKTKRKKNKTQETTTIEVPNEPVTKICPYCLSEIPYKAIRCSHCTSALEDTVGRENKQEQEVEKLENKEP